ncbi:hypothetical protein LR48_Vigan09g076300 [Vigna angularis]|uniref:Uncharacterized protein n=1 Tax=Phaseolus angularis TaxID=3914 RepID=A0A0L9VBR9_PHAAN|nr:hypothetical protein LR48_Vigan09g076300 [Vigna angularis]
MAAKDNSKGSGVAGTVAGTVAEAALGDNTLAVRARNRATQLGQHFAGDNGGTTVDARRRQQWPTRERNQNGDRVARQKWRTPQEHFAFARPVAAVRLRSRNGGRSGRRERTGSRWIKRDPTALTLNLPAFFNTLQKGSNHFGGRTEVGIVCCERKILCKTSDYAESGIYQVTLSFVLAYLLLIMEEKGHNTGDHMSGPSSTAKCLEITTVPCGDDAFVYGNVCGEGPEGRVMSPVSGDEYAWAAREVKELRSQFRSRAVLVNWIENSCILRTLGYQTCVRLVACREDERAFAVLCRTLGIRPTVGLFLYFFRCRPVAKKGWVSLISESGNALLELYLQSYRGFKEKFFKVSITDAGRRYFFGGEGNPKFPLYWTQDPLRFTSWPEDKMTIEELEALSVLTSLPSPFSSRQLINCLEFDDADARVFEIMGRKGSGRNWFQSIGNERAEVSRPRSSSGHAVGQQRTQGQPTGPVVLSVSTDETMVVEEQLVRKRKVKAVDTSGAASKKRKEIADEPERPLPLGVWDPSFTLGHKVELNLDNSEKKVLENMSEQQIVDAMLEMTTRAQMLAWHMAYASDRGTLRVELEKARAELKELIEAHAERDQMSSELEQAKKAMAAVTRERDDLRAETVEDKELIEELKDAVVIEHTRGFRKALRQVGHLIDVSIEGVEFDIQKDVHEGQLKPLNEIPADAFLEEGEEAVANDEHDEAVAGDEPALETVRDDAGDTPNIVID